MTSIREKLKRIRDILNATSAAGRIGHYRKPNNILAPWVVWQEDSEENSFHSDNHKDRQQIHGTIDCFSLTEYDVLFDEIQDALDRAGIGFHLLSVQYEDETNLIHYEWEFTVA